MPERPATLITCFLGKVITQGPSSAPGLNVRILQGDGLEFVTHKCISEMYQRTDLSQWFATVYTNSSMFVSYTRVTICGHLARE